MSFFSRFVPKTAPFFELLQQQNSLLQEATSLLCKIANFDPNAEQALQRLHLLEEEADHLNSEITWELSQTFITPIDREDIGAINLMQERAIDGVRTLGRRFFLAGFIYNRFPAQRMITELDNMAKDTGEMLRLLALKRPVTGPLHTLKARKEECETQLDVGLGELMDGTLSSLDATREIMLWSQIYDRVDGTIGLVSDLADTLEQVALKYV